MLQADERRFATALVAGLLATAAALFLTGIVAHLLKSSAAVGWLLWVRGLSVAAAAACGVWVGARIWHGRIGFDALHMRATSIGWIVAALAAIPLLFGIEYALSAALIEAAPELPASTPREQPLLPPARDYERLALALLTTGLLHPLLEEILCRRYVLRLLLAFGPAVALSVSAIAFGLMHGWSRQAVLSTAGGLVYGWLYYRSGSLVPSVLAHVGGNLTIILLHFFLIA